MALELPLERMQRWFQDVVVHPGTEDEAVAAAEAQQVVPLGRLAEAILPSKTLTPVERLGIYHGMYPMRMVEAMASDYPALQHFVGDHAFGRLVQAYVQVHPSRSFSLNVLGHHFPEFLETVPGLKRRQFCCELARLERAVAQCFDAQQVAPLSEAQIAAVRPEDWERARFEPIPAFQLLAFRYPVNAYLQTVRDEKHDHPAARLKAEYLAVYRRDYAIFRLPMTREAYDLLGDLASGTPLGAAVSAALDRSRRERTDGARGSRRGTPRLTEDQLFKWFREWVGGGVFAEARLN
jgi:hypothetical protein